jgi:3-oxoacyl-[acyl-carrier-protein] synthase III
MQLTTGATGTRILGLGGYQPARIVTNHELAQTLDTSDEWIRSRVGIVSRRVAAPDETVADMAVAAGGKALAASGVPPEDIGLVIVATCSAESLVPNVAATVAHRLGAVAPGAYDLNAACSGFCYALATASDVIRAGSARHALVIGAEKMSAWTDWTDRNTCVLFADGAGAAVLGPVANPGDQAGIGPVVWGSAGKDAGLIQIPDRRSMLTQDGRRVYWWVTNELPAVAAEACRAAGVAPSDLVALIPHQANLRIIEALARRIGAAQAVVADDIIEAGNTSAASIPLALSRLVASGRVPRGGPALLLGFGAGLAFAGQVVIIP